MVSNYKFYIWFPQFPLNLYIDQCKYIYKHISSKNALLSNDRYTNTYSILTGRHRLTTILH